MKIQYLQKCFGWRRLLSKRVEYDDAWRRRIWRRHTVPSQCSCVGVSEMSEEVA